MSLSIKILKELDHPDKHEDYTNTSWSFDNIFLNGDYIMSESGHKIIYLVTDNDYIIYVDELNKPSLYSARSKDNYTWSIIKDGRFIEEVEGKPISVARYIGELIDSK